MTETRADSAVTCVTSVFSALPGETAALPPTSASRCRFNIDTVDRVVCQLGLLLGNTFFFFFFTCVCPTFPPVRFNLQEMLSNYNRAMMELMRLKVGTEATSRTSACSASACVSDSSLCVCSPG